jgi:hypothetical protein
VSCSFGTDGLCGGALGLHGGARAPTVAETLPVSIKSVYNKLNNLEPSVTSALVRHTADRFAASDCRHGGTDAGTSPRLSGADPRW